MTETLYVTSKIDNNSYCKHNGHFARHLRQHGTTIREYFETHVTGYSPLCSCMKPLKFYREHRYAKSCGNPKCVGVSVSSTKSSWSDEKRASDCVNKRTAAALKTPEQIQQQVNRARATFESKYGVSWGSKSSEQKRKSKQTKLTKHGDAAYNNSQQSQTKNKNKSVEEKNTINHRRRITNLALYGVENPFLLPGVKSKSAKSNSQGREFVLPSGAVVGVRGYEDNVLTILLKSYSESDLLFHNTHAKYTLPTFSYVNVNEHTHNYYPDIYIPKENKIIEVKSRWWWDGNGLDRYQSRLENNRRKRAAVIEQGYTYEVWLFEDKNNYSILNNDSNI